MAQNLQLCIVIFMVQAVSIHFVRGDCDPNYGPSGDTDCFLGTPYYSKYQWGTCLTNTYIQTFSKGQYECRNTLAKYCYYQCMVELYDLDEGPVYDDCACGRDAVASTTSNPKPGTSTVLPDWCYSPDGTSCTWYTDCLEKRHPCSDQGYAVEYALKFCNLYSENQRKFSSQGQRWINAVRKCLQVKLVPILRPYIQISCEEIKSKAFETHSPCYLAPYPGEPSICDLQLTDWAKVFWTIKGAFVDAAIPSLNGMIDVTFGCSVNVLKKGLSFIKESGMRLIKLTLGKEKVRISQRSLSDEYNDQANSIGKELATQLHWKQNGVQSFVFITNGSNTDEVEYNILLGSMSTYDVNAIGVPEANLNKTVDELAHAMGSGHLYLSVARGWKVQHFNACLDFDCQETYHDVIPNLKSVSGGTALSPTFVTILVCLLFILLDTFVA